MKIPQLTGCPGDTAIYIKDKGIFMCQLRCLKDNSWFIEKMSGNWLLSDDGECIAEGILVETSAEWVQK